MVTTGIYCRPGCCGAPESRQRPPLRSCGGCRGGRIPGVHALSPVSRGGAGHRECLSELVCRGIRLSWRAGSTTATPRRPSPPVSASPRATCGASSRSRSASPRCSWRGRSRRALRSPPARRHRPVGHRDRVRVGLRQPPPVQPNDPSDLPRVATRSFARAGRNADRLVADGGLPLRLELRRSRSTGTRCSRTWPLARSRAWSTWRRACTGEPLRSTVTRERSRSPWPAGPAPCSLRTSRTGTVSSTSSSRCGTSSTSMRICLRPRSALSGDPAARRLDPLPWRSASSRRVGSVRGRGAGHHRAAGLGRRGEHDRGPARRARRDRRPGADPVRTHPRVPHAGDAGRRPISGGIGLTGARTGRDPELRRGGRRPDRSGWTGACHSTSWSRGDRRRTRPRARGRRTTWRCGWARPTRSRRVTSAYAEGSSASPDSPSRPRRRRDRRTLASVARAGGGPPLGQPVIHARGRRYQGRERTADPPRPVFRLTASVRSRGDCVIMYVCSSSLMRSTPEPLPTA